MLRLKLSELVDENKRLHTELKTTVVHEIMRDGTDLIKVGGIGFLCYLFLLDFIGMHLPDCQETQLVKMFQNCCMQQLTGFEVTCAIDRMLKSSCY